MQDFFTVLAESIFLCFALVMLIDFCGGLFNLIATIQSNHQPELQKQFEQHSKTNVDYKCNIKLDSQLELTPELDLQSVPQTKSHLDFLDESLQEITPLLNLSQFKLYKLRGESVVRVEDIHMNIPTTFKRYKLHKRDVIKLKDLETLLN